MTVPAASPVVVPPDAPQGLSAFFEFQEFQNLSTGAKALPVVRLGWEPAQAETYLLKGYRAWRWEGSDKTAQPVAGSDKTPLLEEKVLDRDVALGKAYAWKVEAIDAKGNTGSPSEPVRLDLAKLPDALLAPHAPEGLTALPGRNQISLQWQASADAADPVSHYVVYRSAGSPRNTTPPASTEIGQDIWAIHAKDAPPVIGQRYTYWVRTVDSAGRHSEPSSPVSGWITGTLPPEPPRKLTVKAGPEEIRLSWEAALPGTAPISEYHVHRKQGIWQKNFNGKSGAQTSLTDKGLDPGIETFYEVRAVDVEGNTSAPVSVSAIPQPAAFIRDAVILMPTAYCKDEKKDSGLNLGGMLSIFVGSFYESFNRAGIDETALVQPLWVVTASGDVKWNFLAESRWTPALAGGLYLGSVLSTGQAAAAQSSTQSISSSDKNATNILGSIFAVASKTLGHRTALHAGLMRGHIADDLVPALPPSWELTLRHLSPGGEISELLPKLVDPNILDTLDAPPNLLFSGLQVPFTVPLGFSRWRTGLRAEVMAPFQPGLERLPYLVNFHVDNLPLFNQFMLSYFRFPAGYEIVAFLNVYQSL
jgi:hypothetical protein